MKKWICCILITMLILGCLPGCSDSPQEINTGNTGHQVTINSCAQTSGYRVAETVNGYYLNLNRTLYYADKTDLSNWVPVCNEPDCNHSQPSCTSKMSYDEFYFYNGRIYTIKHKCDVVPRSTENSQVLVSFAPDGTDPAVEFEIAESNITSGWSDAVLTPDGIYGQYFELLNDGTYKAMVVHADHQGTDVIYEGQTSDDFIVGTQYFWSAREWGGMYGDLALASSALTGESLDELYRIVDGSYEPISHLDECNTWGALLVGGHLYHYEPNDGFYLTDLETGAAKKQMPAQLSDGEAYHLQSDYIVETNIYYGSNTNRPKLLLFENGQWNTVRLPKDAKELSNSSFIPLAVSTEGLFILAGQENVYSLYQVRQAEKGYELTRCGQF